MRIRKEFRRKEGNKSGKLVVIAAEGRKTENIYFEAMKMSLCASSVHVEILDRDDNASSPDKVYERIRGFMQEYSINAEDELWILVDRDRWKKKTLSKVAQLCKQNHNLRFALSNPCFELWLLLHLADVASYSEKEREALRLNEKEQNKTWLERRLQTLHGRYNKSDYDAQYFLRYVDTALKRAEDLDGNPKDRWPQTIGTRVYLLVKSIKAL